MGESKPNANHSITLNMDTTLLEEVAKQTNTAPRFHTLPSMFMGRIKVLACAATPEHAAALSLQFLPLQKQVTHIVLRIQLVVRLTWENS